MQPKVFEMFQVCYLTKEVVIPFSGFRFLVIVCVAKIYFDKV